MKSFVFGFFASLMLIPTLSFASERCGSATCSGENMVDGKRVTIQFKTGNACAETGVFQIRISDGTRMSFSFDDQNIQESDFDDDGMTTLTNKTTGATVKFKSGVEDGINVALLYYNLGKGATGQDELLNNTMFVKCVSH